MVNEQNVEDYLAVPIPEEFHKKNYLILNSHTHGSYSYPDLLVAKTLSHYGKDWHQSHEDLHQEGMFMPTLRQFVDFLNLLNSRKAFDGKGNKVSSNELETILKEITEPRDTLRVEWLDANFVNVDQVLHINYAHQIVNRELQPQRSELLWGCLLVENRLSHISLNDYLERATFQGLPPADVKSGSLNYCSPCSYRVATFEANNCRVGNILGCNSGSSTRNSSFGVRRVHTKD